MSGPDAAARVRLARDRLLAAAGAAPHAREAADRLVARVLALALAAPSAMTSWPVQLARCRGLSAGPGGRDLALFAPGDPDDPDPARRDLAALELVAAAQWPALGELLAPAVPRDVEALGAAHEALLGGSRKGTGSFYTRGPLARAVARRTLAPWLVPRSDRPERDPPTGCAAPARALPHPGPERDPLAGLTVCDPALGCGALLLAALAALAGVADVPRALACLHGVDRDPLAVDLARFALWHAAGRPAVDLGLADRVRCGDSLVGGWLADLEPAPKDMSSRTFRGAPSPVPGDMSDVRRALDRRCARWFPRAPACFHWELEFPAVFAAGGFAAVLANPPWDALKPSAREFLAAHGRLDPADPAADPALAPAWRAYLERHAALARWLGRGGHYRHQGRADRNAYKLFVERSLALLRPGGRLGLLVPAGIYSDHATRELRRLLLDECAWTHLYAFQNERAIFPGVDHRTKVAFVGATRGGATTTLRTRFRLGPGDAPTLAEIEADLLDDAGYLERPAAELRAAAGLAVAELRDPDAAATLAAVRARTAPPLATPGWGARYAREFDMARDAARFAPRPAWEARGHRADEYGHWLAGPWRAHDPAAPLPDDHARSRDGRHVLALRDLAGVAVPLLQGAQIHQHTGAAKAWRRGTGLRATWEPIDPAELHFAPQYLIDLAEARRSPAAGRVRVGYREVCRSTDTRTVIAAVLPPFPAGHKVPNLLPGDGSVVQALALCAELNSLCTDFAARARLGASSLTAAFLADTPLGDPAAARALAPWAARLDLTHPVHAPLWQDPELRARLPDRPWRALWAVTAHERLRLRCILDALVAHHRGLAWSDLARVVAGCDHPAAALARAAFTRTLDPKGFWRVDRDRDPELRHPVLALVAYHDLCARGPAAFLDGDGWQLPAALRLADLGLGHDDRARAPQPVAARLGPRTCPQGQVPDAERSWAACARHAAALARLHGPRAAA
jgi:hypothetical protein